MVGLNALLKAKIEQRLIEFDALTEEEQINEGKEALKREVQYRETQKNAALIIGIIGTAAVVGTLIF